MEVPEWQEEATGSTMEITRLRGEAMGSEQRSTLPGFPLCESAVAGADRLPTLLGAVNALEPSSGSNILSAAVLFPYFQCIQNNVTDGLGGQRKIFHSPS